MKKSLFVLCGVMTGVLGISVWADMSAVSTTTVVTAPEAYQWPVAVMVTGKPPAIVSTFGKRQVLDPQGLPQDELHEGVDFAVPEGTEVHPSRPGRVLFAGFSKAYVSRLNKQEKNHLIIVRHADGFSTRYVHLNRLMVTPGQDVARETVLGTSSQSDEWTEPVVHFEIRDTAGRPVDPEPLLELEEKGP